ncbi:hypothetical protein M153_9050002629, partial [Pseudoloma neurophilia]
MKFLTSSTFLSLITMNLIAAANEKKMHPNATLPVTLPYLATVSSGTTNHVTTSTGASGDPTSPTPNAIDPHLQDDLSIFYDSQIAPAIKNNTNMIISTMEKNFRSLTNQIVLVLQDIKKQNATTSSTPGNGTSNNQPVCGGQSGNTNQTPCSGQSGSSAHPFPGVIEDYTVLIPIAMGTSKCGNCCTCSQGHMCLFNLFIQLQIIIGKYPNWTPPNIFQCINVINPCFRNKSNSTVILEMLLSDLGKKRCRNCNICKQIDSNLKIAFMFNTNVLGTLFQGNGNDQSKELLMAYMMRSEGIDQQINMLPFILNLLSSNGGKCSSNPCTSSGCQNTNGKCPITGQTSGVCPITGQTGNKCPISGNSGPNSCTGNGTSSKPKPKVPTTPFTKNQPDYGVPAPTPQASGNDQPAYV